METPTLAGSQFHTTRLLLCMMIAVTVSAAVTVDTASDSVHRATGRPADTAMAVKPADTVSAADTAGTSGAPSEDEFQTSIDSLLGEPEARDTSGWDTLHVSTERFASESWADTARILLVDSVHGRYYVQPCPGPITSDFGQRDYRWHYGADTRLSKGDTVRSAFDGIARVIGFDRRGYGHVIVIHHADGLETVYGHLSKKQVKIRQRVRAGEPIGLGGNTGHSTGPHLHFEMRYRGEPFDPNYIVDFENSRLKSDTLVLARANFEYLIELRKQKWCTVVEGDNLGRIARRHHSTIANLCEYNHITRKTILKIGRKLRYQ